MHADIWLSDWIVLNKINEKSNYPNVVDDVAGERMESCDINYNNINTFIYTTAITFREYLEVICSKHNNEITKLKQYKWNTKPDESTYYLCRHIKWLTAIIKRYGNDFIPHRLHFMHKLTKL